MRAPVLALPLLFLLVACESATEVIDLRPGTLVAEWTAPDTAEVLSTVAGTPRVRVTNAAGRPIAGVRVTFLPLRDPLVAAASIDTTDAAGIAEMPEPWVLGPVAGPQRLLVFVASVQHGPPLEFDVYAKASPPVDVVLPWPTATDLRPGDTLTLAPSFRDAGGNVTPAPAGLTITSANPSILTVSPSGVARCVAPGVTWIRFTSAGFRDSAEAFVGAPDVTVALEDIFTFGVNAVTVTSGGIAYFTRAGVGLHRYDLAAETELPFIDEPGVNAADIAYSTGADRIWYMVQDSVIGLSGATAVRTSAAQWGLAASRLAATSSGAFVFGVGGSQNVYRLQTGTGFVESYFPTLGTAPGLTLDEARGRLYVTRTPPGAIEELTLLSVGMTRTVGANPAVTAFGVAVHPAWPVLYVVRNGRLQSFRVTDLQRGRETGLLDGAQHVVLSPDGRHLLVSGTGLSSWLIDAATMRVLHTITTGPARAAFDPVSGDVVLAGPFIARRLRIN